ncbi:Predicted metal-dependent peptidase [Rhodovulum sp. ES.010]|uniref:vWA domain-containing protein n=1 Tax=Rhodovulum sp. ES.010 TaxID=1882821 RepID=UPI00092690DA|nr:VWA-like domain-containing protein [Rhodovulum sp. ES.010]SIO50759.1 Predicted metal-dependent peptidase [Rhodovulum sp. ES.010]
MIPQRHSARATRALQKLAEQDPAFAALALWCSHADSDRRDDAAWTDGQAIYYGPGFEGLSLPEQIGLAAHHILHIAFRHAPRSHAMYVRFGDRYDEDLFNLATDAIVNETLMLTGFILPRPAVRLTGLLKATTREQMGGEEAVTTYDAERLYIQLLQDAPPRKGRPGDKGAAGGGGKGEGEGKGSEGGDRPRPGGALAEAARAYAEQQGFAPDLETGRDETDDGAGREEDAEWRQRVARAMEAGRLAGYGIGTLGHRLADLPEVHTPWELVLRGLVTRAVMLDPRPLGTRPARRWLARDADARQRNAPAPAFEPGMLRDREIPRIAVCVDSSASVDGPLLAKFAAELAAIAKRTGAETHVLVFDQAVRSHAVMGGASWEKRISDILFSREGGTSFIEVMGAALALDPSAVVLLTDLEGPFGPPPPPGLPVIWAVPGDPPAHGAPFGRVLSLAR